MARCVACYKQKKQIQKLSRQLKEQTKLLNQFKRRYKKQKKQNKQNRKQKTEHPINDINATLIKNNGDCIKECDLISDVNHNLFSQWVVRLSNKIRDSNETYFVDKSYLRKDRNVHKYRIQIAYDRHWINKHLNYHSKNPIFCSTYTDNDVKTEEQKNKIVKEFLPLMRIFIAYMLIEEKVFGKFKFKQMKGKTHSGLCVCHFTKVFHKEKYLIKYFNENEEYE
jgi:DNA gyrase/topoisomerase IV subunit A